MDVEKKDPTCKCRRDLIAFLFGFLIFGLLTIAGIVALIVLNSKIRWTRPVVAQPDLGPFLIVLTFVLTGVAPACIWSGVNCLLLVFGRESCNMWQYHKGGTCSSAGWTISVGSYMLFGGAFLSLALALSLPVVNSDSFMPLILAPLCVNPMLGVALAGIACVRPSRTSPDSETCASASTL
jgi:hypothetical protein